MNLESSDYNQVFNTFLNYYKEQVSAIDNKQGFNFNVLTEQCGSIVENSHTNILMRLLQFRNQYGYVFLDDFISLSGFDIKINDGEVNFETEYFGKTKAGQGRIDGLIWQQGNFAIIIENKINHAGNQEQQLARYIDTVLKERIVAQDRIFVVFLTRDGIEIPDAFSQNCMKECGICDFIENEEVAGPRYFGCSYSNHIYNWLKDNIQPMIAQKDVVMNAGIIQYIDYLEGLFGWSQNMLKSKKGYQEWFDNRVSLPNNILESNSYLYGLYNSLSRQKDDGDIVKAEAINTLKNLTEAKNDELLGLFMNVTKNFFTSGKDPLIAEYHLNHHFTYYYITIRDKKWPRGVWFEWYPLGLNKLCNSNELTFGFMTNRKRIPDDVEQNLIDLKFEYSDKSKSYRVPIVVSEGKDIGDGTFTGLSEKLQKQFLEEVYRKYAEPIIKNIIPKIK